MTAEPVRPPRAAGLVVLVTGASGGIGGAAALAFAREGAKLGLVARRADLLDVLATELAAAGIEAAVLPADITNEAGVAAAVNACIARFGRIDTLVNAAGVAGYAFDTHETDDAMWAELIDGNLTGPFRVIRAVLPTMLHQRAGAIVNIASIAGLVGMAGMAAYGAAKGGLVALTRAIAVEYGQHGIRCNCLCPGTVETPMTAAALTKREIRQASIAANPLRRIAKPEEIAETILHLGTAESAFMNGAIVAVDGGYTAR